MRSMLAEGDLLQRIAYHLRMRELRACCFPAEAEVTYSRSFEYFSKLVQAGKV